MEHILLDPKRSLCWDWTQHFQILSRFCQCNLWQFQCVNWPRYSNRPQYQDLQRLLGCWQPTESRDRQWPSPGHWCKLGYLWLKCCLPQPNCHWLWWGLGWLRLWHTMCRHQSWRWSSSQILSRPWRWHCHNRQRCCQHWYQSGMRRYPVCSCRIYWLRWWYYQWSVSRY